MSTAHNIDLRGAHALITGGTNGIGWGIAQQLAGAGAHLYLTYKWGSADNDARIKEIVDLGAPKPMLIEADAADEASAKALMERIAETAKGIDIFISNVAVAPQVKTLQDYSKKAFFRTLEYSSWPLINYLQEIYATFACYPRSVIAISSDGPSHYYRGYDFVSASKALLEHFARYLSIHLLPHGSRVNVVRFGTVRTESFAAIFGDKFFEFIEQNGGNAEHILTPEECGGAVLALCSEFMRALNGQVITVDYGVTFKDNLMMRYLDDQEQDGQ